MSSKAFTYMNLASHHRYEEKPAIKLCTCDVCGEDIMEGEDCIYSMEFGYVCGYCVDDMDGEVY